MHPPIFVRKPSAEERARLEAGLRASDAFTVRRAQIVLLSAKGRRPREIARGLRCAVQTVRNGRSTWTLDLLARTAYAEGLSGTVLSAETVRQALLRLKVGWKRAKRWLTS